MFTGLTLIFLRLHIKVTTYLHVVDLVGLFPKKVSVFFFIKKANALLMPCIYPGSLFQSMN